MELFYPVPALSDGVVALRSWSDDDLDCVKEAAADAQIPAGTTVPSVFTAEAGLAFISRQLQRIESGEGVSLAIADAVTGCAQGLIWLGVRPQSDVMGLGYWVVPRVRRRGVGSRAVRLAADWALSELGAARVEAWVGSNNIASQRLLEWAGFTREGVLRSFLTVGDGRGDAVVFSRITRDMWLVMVSILVSAL